MRHDTARPESDDWSRVRGRPAGCDLARRRWRLRRYEHATSALMVALAGAYLVGYAIEVIGSGWPDWVLTGTRMLSDAIWWAFTTMSTVGYGDMYLVTPAGRVIAVGMMTLGVALLGTISATLAAGFLAQTRVVQESETAILLRKLDAMEAKVLDLSKPLHVASGDDSRARAEKLPG